MNLNFKTIDASLICSVLLITTPARAQIMPDTTLGNEASRLTPNQIINGASADRIDGGAVRGSNLFHSFSQFNIDDGQRAFFSSPIGVLNILTRVTGTSASNILGTLGVNGAANLFLINPNGILFGPNASLDVRGSFVGTTANGLQFGNQGNFSATNPEVPGLLTINPSALFFNQINPNAAIQNNSVAPSGVDPAGFDVFGLRVPDGKSLLLVGGNVSMDGGELNAYGGRVELGGLEEPGNINLFFDGNNLRLGFPGKVASATVNLTNQARIYVEGAGGGDIAINARNIEILGGSGLWAGIGEGLEAPISVAGDITLTATEEIKVAGERSRIENLVRLGSKGNGGNITINADSFKLEDNARLAASTYGIGSAGNVIVAAKGTISLTNANIFSSVEAGGIGKSGNIDINAATLSLQDGAQIQAITRKASDAQPAGRGNAGNVNIKVTDVVDIAGKKDTFLSSINSVVETGTIGNAGNITIDAGSLKLSSGAGGLATSTSGQGNAGNVTVQAKNDVTLIDADIFSTVEAGGIGNGGNIDINASSLSLINGAQLLTFTREASDTQVAGRGNAGNINVKVTGNVDIAGEQNGNYSGIRSLVAPLTVGNAGNITINSDSFSLRSGARLNASTRGLGSAGSININTTGAVTISGGQDRNVSAIFADVLEGAKGSGGNININSTTFSLLDGTQLITSTSGIGDAGNVNVNALGTVFLADNSSIISTVGAGGVGNGGDININAANLSLIDGAQLQANTFGASDTQQPGRGSAGNINIKVTGLVDMRGVKNGFKSAIGSSVETGTEGRSGNITIDAGSFKLQDGAALDARTNNNDRGGDITVNTNIFEVLTGGQLTTTTSNNGRAGKITVNAKEKVIVSGSDPNYNDRVANFSSDILNIGANAGFFVNSTGLGTTGDIEINSPNITLDNQGKLQANSASGNGGNIKLNSDLLLLRRGTQISTNAGTEKLGGDGGNIDIDSRFIVAVPNENSDITANAFTGKGGNVNIHTQSILGITPAFNTTPNSDITASSEFGVQGQIAIAQPDVDPTQGIIELPTQVVDVSNQIGQLCPRGVEAFRRPLNEFIVTGRGSLPPNPLQPMPGRLGNRQLATLESNIHSQQTLQRVDGNIEKKPTSSIVEAQGWIKNADGTISLVAPVATSTPNNRMNVPACPVLN